MLRGPSTAMAEGSHRPSVMYFIYSVAVCLTFVHRTRGLPWPEEKVSLGQKKGNFNYVVILTCWNAKSAFRGMQMSSDAKRNSTLYMKILNYFFLSITCSTLWWFLYNRIWRQLLKKEKNPKAFFSYIYSINKYIYAVVSHHHSRLPVAQESDWKKIISKKAHLCLIHSFSQNVPVFAWPLVSLIYVAPHTSSPGCYGSTAFASDPSNCRSWYL